jgi:hypothetical protein
MGGDKHIGFDARKAGAFKRIGQTRKSCTFFNYGLHNAQCVQPELLSHLLLHLRGDAISLAFIRADHRCE